MRSDSESIAALFGDKILRRFGRLTHVRPMVMGALGVRLLAPIERRRIVETKVGIRLHVDPLSHGGREIRLCGTYEDETFRIHVRAVPFCRRTCFVTTRARLAANQK
jgi:hypothetical protein